MHGLCRAPCTAASIKWRRHAPRCKEEPAEVERAKQCYRALFDAVMTAGYIPYRVGIQSMAAQDPHGNVFWKVVSRIKAALDPDGIIAPGRYEPARAGARM